MSAPRVTIVGAGVSGLTTALALRQQGIAVRVIADRAGIDATSGAAGAVWFPYKAVPGSPAPGADAFALQQRVYRWAEETYAWCRELAASEPECGVRPSLPLYFTAMSSDPDDAEWMVAVPSGVDVDWVPLDQLPPPLAGHARAIDEPPLGAWRLDAPVVVPSVHLAWLEAQVGAENIRTDHPTVEDLSSIEGAVVVHCAGRRARALNGDAGLQPQLGQVVVARDSHLPREHCVADDRDDAAMLYTIVRGEEVVLGGFSLPSAPDDDTPWTQIDAPLADATATGAILDRFESAGVVRPELARAVSDWRPVHAEGPRVGFSGKRTKSGAPIIDNYGHGGSGYTLAWGCARAVVESIRELQPELLRG